MPPPFPLAGHVKVEIAARLAAGETLRTVCGSPGMPTERTVNNWMRADPGFAAEVAAARAKGDWRRRCMFDEAKADAILARVRTGEPMAAILRSPGMPSRETVAHWRATQNHFRSEIARVWHERAKGQPHLRARYREFDEALADRILLRIWRGETLRAVLRSDRALPCLAVLERWRRERPEYDRALRKAMRAARRKRGSRLCTPELTQAIVARIVEGASLRSLAAEPDMPCARTLYSWARTRPDFAADVERACEDREDWYLDRMLMAAQAIGPASQRALTRASAPWSKQLTRLRKRPGWKRRAQNARAGGSRSWDVLKPR